MDLDTFLTTVYVIVDDWYKQFGTLRRKRGAPTRMSDSEVLTVALVGQWRVGVPWRSERGVVRYMQHHGRGWFPTMLERSAFNQRVRNLWAALVCLQQAVVTWMRPYGSAYECFDCVPLRACSVSQARKRGGHWWWWSRHGHGGTHGSQVFGDQLGVSVTPEGVVTGWLVSEANVDDRWLLQTLLCLRAGQPTLPLPTASASGKYRLVNPPTHLPHPALAAGQACSRTYVVDGGFNGARWHPVWAAAAAVVLAPPPPNAPDAWSRPLHRWHRHVRQPVETVFALLTTVFSLARVSAHSRWGQLTQLAAMFAAYNLGLWLNPTSHRPLHAHATLIC